MKIKIAKKSGFTLIELLVVIAIIGLLSTLAIVALNSSRIKSRDAKRLADVRQIQTALELYYDKNGNYPLSGGCSSSTPNGAWCNSVESQLNGYWLRSGSTNHLSEFMSADPVDPNPSTSASFTPVGGGAYFYFSAYYEGAGQWYMIVFGLENRSHSFQDKDGVNACHEEYFHYGNGSNGVITTGVSCIR